MLIKKNDKNVKGQQTIKKLVSDISAQTFIKNFVQENMDTFASLSKPTIKTRRSTYCCNLERYEYKK